MATRDPSVRGNTDTPTLARARELFGYVINGHDEIVSTSSGIADRIEQRVCVAPATFGAFTETALSREFCVGRRIARQTSRVLQLRGIMEPRRGGNGLGGLWVMEPSLDRTLAAVGAEVGLAGFAAAKAEARRWLIPTGAGTNDALARLVRSLLDANNHAATDPIDARLSLEPGNQAHRLATRLLGELALMPPDQAHLGSVASISSAYGVSFEVVVEAIRTLTDAQRVEVSRGRGGGVFSCASRAGLALHVTNAYLAAHEITTKACRHALDSINLGMIELARERKTAAGLERVEQSFRHMQEAPDATTLGKTWYGFIRDIADMSGNPVLHFLARALAASILMRRTRSAELPDAAARELLAASQQILDHLRQARSVTVEEAHLRCQQALENYW